MPKDCVIDEIREALNGRPGQPIVFGVCKTLADRFGKEPFVFRLAAVLLMLFWTLPALAAYVIAGLVMKETEPRTRQFFAGLAVIVREKTEQAAAWLRDCCVSERQRGY